MSSVWHRSGIAAALVMMLASDVSVADLPARIGDERVLTGPLDHDALATGTLSVAEMIAAGRHLFVARFTKADGAGRPAATAAEVPTRRQLGDTPAFHRTSGPDANACAGCHIQQGPGGSGDFAMNVFVAPQDMEWAFDSVAPDLSMERGTTAIHGAGLLELLAREMTRDLQAQRASAVAEARRTGDTVRVGLASKGVSFGSLAVDPDGFLDVSDLAGIHPDLIVKPFSQKAVTRSLRQFTVTAFNTHHGLQATERFGTRWTGGADFDKDGVADELGPGDVTAAVLFQAALPPPRQRLPDHPVLRAAVEEGERLFDLVGCTSCHVPALELESALFTEPGPYNPPGTLGTADTDAVVAVDLVALWPERVTRSANGKLLVQAYTDMKRHRIADADRPHFANELLTQNFVPRDQFRTAPLWGVGSTAPYGHRGDLTTLREAIQHHGGDATAVRQAYDALSPDDRAKIIEFLKSLKIEG